MQNWRESYEKIFGEMKNLLSELSKSDTYEDILAKENEINQLYQKFLMHEKKLLTTYHRIVHYDQCGGNLLSFF